jgi:hypothetical protein
MRGTTGNRPKHDCRMTHARTQLRWSTTARPIGSMLSAILLSASLAAGPASASSHMDAPLVTFDPAANTTDVYAFLSRRPGYTKDYLTVAFAVYPFEEPGIGPNIYGFDDRVLYDIHLSFDDNIAKGKTDRIYRFRTSTTRKEPTTILPYLGEVEPAANGSFSDNQNFRQTFSVTLVDFQGGKHIVRLGKGLVPPNNQGRVTRFYNQNDDGDNKAKEGVAYEGDLDPYTKNAIYKLHRGHRIFAGQRDDGFYADVQSVFDLDATFGTDTTATNKPFDSQGGFNVHTVVLEIPLEELGGATMAGVWVKTSRRGADDNDDDRSVATQIGRQGNPLFNELFVAFTDKDRYSRTHPRDDSTNFAKYADDSIVELAKLLGTTPIVPGLLKAIFIPDLIKVDLTTGPARLAGESGFHRLGVFGKDVLLSKVQDPFGNGGFISGGWPNGRRFGDDVENIGLIALGAAGPLATVDPDFNASRVSSNDITYNQVFPYAATPHNGRAHDHH